MTDFYVKTGTPASHSSGSSASMRAEFTAIETAMAKLAGYTGNGSKFIRVNAAGTAYEALTAADALAALAPSSAALATALTDTTGTGVFVRTQAPTLTSATLVTPALGTPASGVLTNCTGTASGLTAGNVTTNANLTGGVTSVGNAATVVTNANLTGVVTSVGNATTLSLTKAQLDTAISDGNAVYVNDTPALVGTNFSGTAAGLTSGSATLAATVTVADAAADTTTWPMLATSQTGNQAPTTDAGLTYNASTNVMGASISGNAATATTCSDEIGVGQTWQDVTASRAKNTRYTNNTSRPIYISIRVGLSSLASLDLTTANETISMANAYNGNAASTNQSVSAIIPINGTYYLSSASGTVGYWSELR